MADRIVLVVSDEGSDKHGEVSVFDTADEAERQMETLLEAGFDQRRIQVFAGSQTGFETSYRPVVSLADGTDQGGEPDRPAGAIGQAAPRIFKARGEAEGAAGGDRGNGRSASGDRISDSFRSVRDDALDLYTSAADLAS